MQVLLIMLALALLASCGAGGSTPWPARGDVATTSSGHPHYVQDLATALAELDALECPEGADPEVFAQIREDMRRMLVNKYSGKQVSDYNPTHEHVKVRGFDWDPGGTYGKLVWIYVNDGDYNQDSTVNVSDITPLAAHYDEEVTGDNTIQELIDEDDEDPNGQDPPPPIYDGDGLVDGEGNRRYDYHDADTIDFCWNTYIVHYSVQGASSYGGPWNEVATVDFGDHDAAKEGEARYRFHWDISTTSYAYFRIVPVGGPGDFEEEEQESEVIRLSPDVTGVTWSASPKSGETATATANLERPDIPPITGWSWNFGGGATPNTSNEAHPTVTFGRGGTYDAWVEVTNAFGTDHYDFDLEVEAWWHIEVVDPRESKFTSLAFAPDGWPGISYWADNTIRYVKFDGEDWNEEFAQGPAQNFPGVSTSVAYSANGNAWIAFTQRWNNTATLMLAVGSGDQWEVDVVNEGNAGYDCSLALHPTAEEPGISHFQMVEGLGDDWLTYSHPVEGAWLHDIVSPGPNDGDGVGTSLGFDPSTNDPRITFYHDLGAEGLIYAWFDGLDWHADPDEDSVEHGYRGHWSSLEYDADGNPAISYFDSTLNDPHLRFALRVNGDWQCERVDSEIDAMVGEYTSLGFDSYGRPVISYYRYHEEGHRQDGDLKVAWFTGALPPQPRWDIQTVDDYGDIGTYTSLAIDSYGCPAISYGGDDLRFALWW